MIRQAAAESVVLLRNDGVLPLQSGVADPHRRPGRPRRGMPRIQGGGSAQVVERRITSPLEALTSALGGDVEVVFERGCEVDQSATLVGRSVLCRTRRIRGRGVRRARVLGRGACDEPDCEELRLFVFSAAVQDYPEGEWSLRARGRVVPSESGRFQLALAQVGRARVLVDGVVVLDGFENPPPPGGRDFFGFASQELVGEVELVAGQPVEFVLEYARVELGRWPPCGSVSVPSTPTCCSTVLRRRRRDADVAVVFVGTTHEWETEGRDRTTLSLPGSPGRARSSQSPASTLAPSSSSTRVRRSTCPGSTTWPPCCSAGSEAKGWPPGVADVLTGTSDPGGRLPTTVPVRLEHSPSHDNFPGENGELRYGEGLFMGYRGFEHRCIEPRYPFGHGLSYTTFEFGELSLSSDTFSAGTTLQITVDLRNSGERAGTEVVQCYVAPESPRLARPDKELKAFAKVRLGPGESRPSRPRAHRPRLRLLGSGSSRLGRGGQPIHRDFAPGGGTRSAGLRLADRPGLLPRADRPIVGRHRC